MKTAARAARGRKAQIAIGCDVPARIIEDDVNRQKQLE